jgi:thymidylate synthase (FAD)
MSMDAHDIDVKPQPRRAVDIKRVPFECEVVDLMQGCQRWEIQVLDHGFIALVDVMPRLVPVQQSADSAAVQAARVSYGIGTRKVQEDRGLIRYLLRHRHTTPFEMIELKFHVSMPIFIARQWIRHRTASVNEYSGRYSIVPDQFYRPDQDAIRKQSSTNRQGGSDTFDVSPSKPNPDRQGGDSVTSSTSKPNPDRQGGDSVTDALPTDPQSSPDLSGELRTAQDFLTLLDRAESLYPEYERLLEAGVSRELARIALPLSTYTQWYWKCDLHNILHFLKLRLDPHAQEEIRAYAQAMHDLIEPIVPITMEAFRDYELESIRLTRLEVQALRGKLAGGDPTLGTTNKREQAEWSQKRVALGLERSES